MTWTDERVSLLRQLWGNGKSASEIAQILGDEITRNAVIGKAHRLGLSGRPSPIRKKPAAEAEVASGATILSLTDRMCKWPIGDPREPGFHFCGRPSVAGLPYCQEHAALAYQSPNAKRREGDAAAGVA